MVRSITAIWLTLGFVAGATWGSNIYSVSYEGDALPEVQDPNWHRHIDYGGAVRTIETDPNDPSNHWLVINSLGNQMIYDYVDYSRQMNPDGPDEFFWAEWRVLVAEHHGTEEQGVGFAADTEANEGFTYAYNHLEEAFYGWEIPFAPGVFHTYRFESMDMLHYKLFLDGAFKRDAEWFNGYGGSSAGFGDTGQGGQARSIVKYDYVRFGVSQVPEPASSGPLLGLCAFLRRKRGSEGLRVARQTTRPTWLTGGRRACEVQGMKGIVLLALAAWAAGESVASNLYTVSYEGDALPEVQDPNWHRHIDYGGAVRTIETDPNDPSNHWLVINSLGNQMIYDYVDYHRQMNPDGPNEFFWAEWRILVAEHHGAEEQGVGFHADTESDMGFNYAFSHVEAAYFGWEVPFTPGIFHTYRVESMDMLHYKLFLDGAFNRDAEWFNGYGGSYAHFGDGGQGGQARSIVKYDYVRFGVSQVPEPASSGLLLGLCVLLRRRRG